MYDYNMHDLWDDGLVKRRRGKRIKITMRVLGVKVRSGKRIRRGEERLWTLPILGRQSREAWNIGEE